MSAVVPPDGGLLDGKLVLVSHPHFIHTDLRIYPLPLKQAYTTHNHISSTAGNTFSILAGAAVCSGHSHVINGSKYIYNFCLSRAIYVVDIINAEFSWSVSGFLLS